MKNKIFKFTFYLKEKFKSKFFNKKSNKHKNEIFKNLNLNGTNNNETEIENKHNTENFIITH